MPPKKKNHEKGSQLKSQKGAQIKLQKKILFCKGTEYDVLKDASECANYEAKIRKLLSGDYSGLHYDYKGEHKGIKAFTIRLNRADRVLFSYQKNQDNCFLVIRELLLGHNYRDSKVLRDLGCNLTSEEMTHLSAETPETPETKAMRALELKDVNLLTTEELAFGVTAKSGIWLHNKIVVLSDPQENAANVSMQMPFLAEGPPGSGKSLVLLCALANLVRRHHPEDGPILITAQSESVVAYLKKLWEENFPEAWTDETKTQRTSFVEFTTYKSVILERMAPAERPQTLEEEVDYFIGYEAFKAWYREFRTGAPTVENKTIESHSKAKVKPKNKPTKIDELHYVIPHGTKPPKEDELEELLCRAVYQELRVISAWQGYPTAHGQPLIGQKDSYFDITTKTDTRDPAKIKNWITQVYREYPDKQRDLAFLKLPAEKYQPEFSRGLADEVQDFSTEQWALLTHLSGGQLGGYLDSFQSVNADKPMASALTAVSNTIIHGVSCDTSITLPDTYRCPVAAAKIATVAKNIRNELAGGAGRKGLTTELKVAETESDKIGHAHIYLPKSSKEQETIVREIRAHLGCYKASEVVIISNENKHDVQQIFGRDSFGVYYTVLTPEEAKGLEFDCVILWNPLGNPDPNLGAQSVYNTYKNANTKLRVSRETGVAVHSSQHQALLENMDNRFSRQFQALFTALTRTKKRVIFCQSQYGDKEVCRDHKYIIDQLSKAFPDPEALPRPHLDGVLMSTDEDYIVQIEQHLLSGHIGPAQELIQGHFYREEMDLNQRLKRYLVAHYQELNHDSQQYNASFEALPVESRVFIKKLLGELKPVVSLAKKASAVLTSKDHARENISPLIEANMYERLNSLLVVNPEGERPIDLAIISGPSESAEDLVTLFEILFDKLHTGTKYQKNVLQFLDAILLNTINGKPIVPLFYYLAKQAIIEQYAPDEEFDGSTSKRRERSLQKTIDYANKRPAVTLLSVLSQNTDFIHKLKAMLKKDDGLAYAPDEQSPSFLYLLSAAPIGFILLEPMFQEASVRNKITGKAFFTRYDYNTGLPFIGTSAFFSLSWQVPDIVEKLFNEGNIFLDKTPLTTTYQPKQNEKVLYFIDAYPTQNSNGITVAPISPFYLQKEWFSSYLGDARKSMQLLPCISRELVNEILPEQEGLRELSGVAAYNVLIWNPLPVVFDIDIHVKVTLDTLSYCLRKSDNYRAHGNPHFIMKIIAKDINDSARNEKPARSYKEIFHEICRVFIVDNKAFSLLFNMARQDIGPDTGWEFFQQNIITNPTRAKELSEALVESFKTVEKPEIIARLLYDLCQLPGSVFCLRTLITANPDFFKEIPIDYFLKNFIIEKNGGCKNLLGYLLSRNDPENTAIINTIFSQAVNWKMLESICTNSGLYPWLARLLHQLFITSTPDNKIPVNAAFYYIAASDAPRVFKMLDVFIKIFEGFRDLDDKMAIRIQLSNALFQFSKHKHDGLLSPLFFLSLTPEKRTVLLNILAFLRPTFELEYVIQCSKNALALVTPVRAGGYEGKSPLHHLVKNPDAMPILAKLFQPAGEKEEQLAFISVIIKKLCEQSAFLGGKTPIELICQHSNAEARTVIDYMKSNIKLIELMDKRPELFSCRINSVNPQKTIGDYFIIPFRNHTLSMRIERAICKIQQENDQTKTNSRSHYQQDKEFIESILKKFEGLSSLKKTSDETNQSEAYDILYDMLSILNSQDYDRLNADCQNYFDRIMRPEASLREMLGGLDRMQDIIFNFIKIKRSAIERLHQLETAVSENAAIQEENTAETSENLMLSPRTPPGKRDSSFAFFSEHRSLSNGGKMNGQSNQGAPVHQKEQGGNRPSTPPK